MCQRGDSINNLHPIDNRIYAVVVPGLWGVAMSGVGEIDFYAEHCNETVAAACDVVGFVEWAWGVYVCNFKLTFYVIIRVSARQKLISRDSSD